MSHPSSAENIEGIVDELIALYLAQAADLHEYAQAATVGEGTVHLQRTLCHRAVQLVDLYPRFEKAAFPASATPDVHGETIAVAEPEGGVRGLGTIANRQESICKLIRKLGSAGQLRVCHEAGARGRF